MTDLSLTRVLIEGLRQDVKRAGDRQMASAHYGFYNVMSTAIGAATKPAASAVAAWSADAGNIGRVPVPARADVFGPFGAALLVGFAGHAEDFDDTHLKAVVHPGATTLGAVWAAGLAAGASGEDVIRGYLVGCEAQLRIKLAVRDGTFPEHEASFTGILSPIGAAVGAGYVAGLSDTQLCAAVTLAVQSSSGLRASLGTMAKPLQPGRGAATGLVAAQAARTVPFDGLPDLLGGPGGYYDAYFDGQYTPDLLASSGQWHIDEVAFKPYPCGVVIHPFVDAALAVRHVIEDPEAVEQIVLRCNPMVRDDTGITDPTDELSAKFSVYHGVAATIYDGELTPWQYEDHRVTEPGVAALRRKVRLDVDHDLRRHEGELTLRYAGTATTRFVEAARGSSSRPMTDSDLRTKARGLLAGLVQGSAEDLWRVVAGLPSAPSMAELVACVEPTA